MTMIGDLIVIYGIIYYEFHWILLDQSFILWNVSLIRFLVSLLGKEDIMVQLTFWSNSTLKIDFLT